MDNKTNNLHAKYVTEKELASILNISEGRIRSLVTEGVLTRAYRGQYNEKECVKQYISYLQEIARKREKPVSSEDADYNEQRARLTKLQADKAELDLDIRLGQYVKTEAVTSELENVFINMRAKLLSLPGRAASELLGVKKQTEMQAILKKIIYEALDELTIPDFGDNGEKQSSEGDI